ncbi:DnaJ-class molecular chaperone with C-terminal Zn finger domain [Alteromonadaceae bacterium Bs31]|nr:DnaJ-class molecular chaperone with C-terminal Zn finger domain [Alteromonadaceae bacterium Bs31]
MLPSCYKTLGVVPGASREEIKLAYRRLATFYHPDKNPGDRHAAEMFRLVIDAYQQLKTLPAPEQANSSLPVPLNTRCRRKRRGTPSDRRYCWQHPDEYIGRHIKCEA